MRLIKSVVACLCILLVVGGVFAAAHEVSARANNQPSALRQALANPQETLRLALASLPELRRRAIEGISGLGTLFTRPVAEQAETVSREPEQAEPKNVKQPAARPAPPVQPRQKRQPAPRPVPAPRESPVPPAVPPAVKGTLVEPVYDAPAVAPAPLTYAEIQRAIPEEKVFFFCEELTQEVVRQVNEARAAHGRGALVLHPRLVESAKTKVYDMLVYRYFAHDSPRLGTHQELIHRFMFPEAYAAVSNPLLQAPRYFPGENLGESSPVPFYRFTSAEQSATSIRGEKKALEERIVGRFMHSPGHRDSMLNLGDWHHIHWDYIGIAAGYIYWHDPVLEGEKPSHILACGKQLIIRRVTKLAMHLSPAEEHPPYVPGMQMEYIRP